MRRIVSIFGASNFASAVPNEPEPRMAADLNLDSGISEFLFTSETMLGAVQQSLNIDAVFADGENGNDDAKIKQRLIPCAGFPERGQ
jgi:hypothetical protein